MAMMGKLTPAMTQGQNESILLARASSRAPALYGLVKSCLRTELLTSAPCWMAEALCSPTCSSSCGDSSGDEKESR